MITSVWGLKFDRKNYCILRVANREDIRQTLDFSAKQTQINWKPIRVVLYQPEDRPCKLGDFSSFGGGTNQFPLFSDRAWRITEPLISANVQRLPLETDTSEPFYALNVQKMTDCINYERSKIEQSDTSKRSIKKINPLVLKQKPLQDSSIFHIQDFEVAGFFVSDEVKQAIEQHHLGGLIFKPIQLSE